MIKLINGLIPHFVKDVLVEGTVTVADKNISRTPMYEIAELVGSVFQNPKTQFFHTDSWAEMAFGLENRGAEPEYIQKRMEKTVAELNIKNLAHRKVFSMSGGDSEKGAYHCCGRAQTGLFAAICGPDHLSQRRTYRTGIAPFGMEVFIEYRA